jgi:predicted transcriptional regulator YdeE
MDAEFYETKADVIVVGPSIRTSPEKAAQDIPAFWQRFSRQGFLERLPRRQNDPSLYAIYCEYEGDYSKPYTMILGVSVEPGTRTPDGTQRVLIPSGSYARFLAKGDPSQVIWSTWMHICERWERRRERRYAADFERYELSSLASMAQGEVEAEIVVGLASR